MVINDIKGIADITMLFYYDIIMSNFLDNSINFVYTVIEVIIMVSTIQKWGNSQGIRLPKIFLDDLNMREGNEVEIFIQNNSIIIKHAAQKRNTIQELFADYDGEYTPEEIEWGNSVGGEVW